MSTEENLLASEKLYGKANEPAFSSDSNATTPEQFYSANTVIFRLGTAMHYSGNHVHTTPLLDE
ncbi:hypothetical protein BJ956_002398 [Arthrobacter psychrochitiniphilus]|nr:hypothetical protein [Arthrobacter psychrochitiniphilus]